MNHVLSKYDSLEYYSVNLASVPSRLYTTHGEPWSRPDEFQVNNWDTRTKTKQSVRWQQEN